MSGLRGTPWDSGRTGTSVHRTREERTGADEGLMGRNGAREGKEEKRQEKEESIVTSGRFIRSNVFFYFC